MDDRIIIIDKCHCCPYLVVGCHTFSGTFVCRLTGCEIEDCDLNKINDKCTLDFKPKKER